MKSTIKERMKKLKMTVPELSEKTGIDVFSLYKIRNDLRIPKLKPALKIAKALETTVDKLWQLEADD